MMNQYSLWKYLLIICVLVVGTIYALPNLYGEDPALQVSGSRTGTVDASTEAAISSALETAGIPLKAIEATEGQLLIRFNDTEAQLKAVDYVKSVLGRDYIVALNLAPATPEWLESFNALPMYLGLDLRGGVHFLMEVDMEAAVKRSIERYSSDLRAVLREARIRYAMIRAEDQGVRVMFRSPEDRDQATSLLRKEFDLLQLEELDINGKAGILAKPGEQEIREIRQFALQQNILTLRNRVNELGVAEPVIQQQGTQRIVVQLPGVRTPPRQSAFSAPPPRLNTVPWITSTT